jgi:hypothetical protein
MRREPGGDEEATDLRLAEDVLVVGRERLGAVDHAADARVGHGRDAPDRARHDRLEAGHVGAQQLAVEVGRDPVETPRRRFSLVAAHAQATDLLAEVDEVVRVAQLRQAGVDALDRLGEQVLVRHRDERDGHAGQSADLGREHPARVDHDVGADLVALAGLLDGHARDATAVRADRHDPRPRPDADTSRARPGGQRVRQPRRVEPAVGRQEQGAQDTIGRHEREQGVRLIGPDQLDRQAERPGPAGLPPQLLESLGARRQAERPDLVPRRVDASLSREPPVLLDAVDHHPREGHRPPELTDEPGRVERRAGGQLGPLHEHDVRPAAAGEVVRD